MTPTQIVDGIRTLKQLPFSAASFLDDPTVPATQKEFYERMIGVTPYRHRKVTMLTIIKPYIHVYYVLCILGIKFYI